MEINNILRNYIAKIDTKEIQEITNNTDNTAKIVEIIRRYLAYYIFLAIGYFYNGRKETYINNIVEFTKNQSSFNYKINNFFNSENNANLVNYFDIVNNTVLFLTLEPSKLDVVSKKLEFKSTIKFLNTYGQDYINENFRLENLGGNKNDQAHNIIKTIIFNELYFGQEKDDVFTILEMVEKQEGTYIFINIVLPRTIQIDFAMVEKSISEKDIKTGYATEVYEYLKENEDVKPTDISIDDKILTLINNKILIPISEDFMLYHKDSEKYEKVSIGDTTKSKKKEDTKIRYVVSKVDNVSEYYSDRVQNDPQFKKNIEKLFYTPFDNRNAILINEIEEVNIIAKLLNQGKRSLENNEYYNDLMTIRQYPYINFKDFKKYGISITMNKTVDVIRSVSLEKDNLRTRDRIQLRVGSDGQQLNIVAFMIAPRRSIHCLTNNQLINIKRVGKNENGYQTTLQLLRKVVNIGKKPKHSYFWLLNPEKDIVTLDNYIQLSKVNPIENLKLTVSNMYNDLVNEMFMYIQKRLDKDDEVPIPDGLKLMNEVERKYFRISSDSDMYRKLRDYIFFVKYKRTTDEYDKKEDIFYGFFGDIIKLPSASKLKRNKDNVIVVKREFHDDIRELEDSEAQKVGAVCQHNVSWEWINSLKRSDYGMFTKKLYEFIQQFVIESHDQEYVCKSCGTLIDIKKYIPDGMYDVERQRFVTFNMPMEVQLEDLPEYNKYRLTIRSIEKIVERIATIGNITYYVGSSVSVKMRRKTIVKNVIDMISIHNKTLSSYYRQRNEKITQMYGVSKDLTNLFVFELEDSIFVYSSKERDYYKHIKHNNVVVYIVLSMILDLNQSQIIYMKGDKVCNHYWFDTVGHMLFNGLQIKINNKGDTQPITNFRIICYLLYLMGCFVSKYGIWFYHSDGEEQQPKSKVNIIIQKVFIHTTIDILNSILEVPDDDSKMTTDSYHDSGTLNNRPYQYEIFQTKFYVKLKTLFQDNNLSNILKKADEKKIVTIGDKRMYIVVRVPSIPLKPYTATDYSDYKRYRPCVMKIYYIPKSAHAHPVYHNINNITNAPDGNFYDWIPKDGTLVSKKYGTKINALVLNDNDSEMASKGYYLQLMKKLAERYCPNGDVHNYVYSPEHKTNICKKCQFKDADTLSKEQLLKFENIARRLNEARDRKSEIRKKMAETKQKDLESKHESTISNLKTEYGSSKDGHKNDYFNFIDKFVENIKNIIGTDEITGGISLVHNKYIIDHDHHGNLLGKEIELSGKEEKVIYKENHPFFKTDVIYYTNQREGMDVFYDAITHVLLGYKESHREFVTNQQMRRYIKIKYSLHDRLKLLGYTAKYINLSNKVKGLKDLYGDDVDGIIKRIIADISRDRIINLKRIIGDLQRRIHQIKYGFISKMVADGDRHDILEEFRKKITKLTLKDSEGKNKLFKKWNDVVDGIYFLNLDRITVNVDAEAEFISTDEISRYDYHGNIILFYIVKELDKIIQYNTNKFIRMNVVQMLITLINYHYEQYSEEELFHSLEMKRFQYRLQSQQFVYDIEQKGHGLEDVTSGFYGEYVDPDEKPSEEELEEKDDIEQAAESLDIDEYPEDATDDFTTEFASQFEETDFEYLAYGNE